MRTPVDPTPALVEFEKRHQNGEAGALLGAGAAAVAALQYLVHIDKAFEARQFCPAVHDPAVIDMAHALWATSTCISAIDRCAAAMARALCGYRGGREVDANELWSDRSARGHKVPFRQQLSTSVVDWIEGVRDDAEYDSVRAVRDRLVHSRIPRHFTMVIGSSGPPDRIQLDFGSKRVSVAEVVSKSFEVADRHVSLLFDRLPQL